MSYKKIDNIYYDGFENYCDSCCQKLPTFKVIHNKNNYEIQLNNKKHVRLFNNSSFVTAKYNTIKSVELNKDTKTITLYRNHNSENIEFKSKHAVKIYDTLNEYLHYYSN